LKCSKDSGKLIANLHYLGALTLIDYNGYPTSPLERVKMIEGILIAAGRGKSSGDGDYQILRQMLVKTPVIGELLPQFVNTYRDLGAFWPYIKAIASTYAERDKFVRDSFTPVFAYLEGRDQAPGDQAIAETLGSFDAEGVHAVWSKALVRRTIDPEGAITSARTLLETVCKRVLEETNTAYDEGSDLPALYSTTARVLNLAPNQHTEEPIKAILGSAMNLVNGIGTLRNRFSDAHARGGKLPVKPSTRHASLAVNMAGTMATFLVETYLERNK
jgi:hypothetical protein